MKKYKSTIFRIFPLLFMLIIACQPHIPAGNSSLTPQKQQAGDFHIQATPVTNTTLITKSFWNYTDMPYRLIYDANGNALYVNEFNPFPTVRASITKKDGDQVLLNVVANVTPAQFYVCETLSLYLDGNASSPVVIVTGRDASPLNITNLIPTGTHTLYFQFGLLANDTIPDTICPELGRAQMYHYLYMIHHTTVEPSPSPSPSVLPSASPSVSPSPTVMPSPTPTPTINPTPSPSPTVTASATPTPDPSPSEEPCDCDDPFATFSIQAAAPKCNTKKCPVPPSILADTPCISNAGHFSLLLAYDFDPKGPDVTFVVGPKVSQSFLKREDIIINSQLFAGDLTNRQDTSKADDDKATNLIRSGQRKQAQIVLNEAYNQLMAQDKTTQPVNVYETIGGKIKYSDGSYTSISYKIVRDIKAKGYQIPASSEDNVSRVLSAAVNMDDIVGKISVGGSVALTLKLRNETIKVKMTMTAKNGNQVKWSATCGS